MVFVICVALISMGLQLHGALFFLNQRTAVYFPPTGLIPEQRFEVFSMIIICCHIGSLWFSWIRPAAADDQQQMLQTGIPLSSHSRSDASSVDSKVQAKFQASSSVVNPDDVVVLNNDEVADNTKHGDAITSVI